MTSTICIYCHYNDVIMSTMASQITSLTNVYSAAYSGADERKHQCSASLAFVRGIHRWPVNSPHNGFKAMVDFRIILGMRSANGRRCYNVTSSLNGWAHTQNDFWVSIQNKRQFHCYELSRLSLFSIKNFLIRGTDRDELKKSGCNTWNTPAIHYN